MKNKVILALLVGIFMTSSTFALAPKETAQYFNGPSVSNISSSGATLFLSDKVLSGITPEERQGIYFEYVETHLVCIMIYPTPESCLPKKTEPGKTSVNISGLKPNTTYTVKYKRDNTINFESLSVEFTTLPEESSGLGEITKDLRIGLRDKQVEILQKILIEQGYLSGSITGYFGNLTRLAVINYQKMHNLLPTGYVGRLTRASFLPAKGEKFEGIISAYSTGCFVDGICSVTVDGKVVVTTRGWARDPVGNLRGVESIADVQNKIGHKAKVYAAKTSDGGYTLYGNKDFYLEVQ